MNGLLLWESLSDSRPRASLNLFAYVHKSAVDLQELFPSKCIQDVEHTSMIHKPHPWYTETSSSQVSHMTISGAPSSSCAL